MNALKHQCGTSLIEILIAIIVVVIGLLGIARYNIETMRSNQSSMQRTTAVMLSYSMLDRLRANREAALDGDYDRTFPGTGGNCDAPAGNTLVQRDLNIWITSLQNTLAPDACGAIDCERDATNSNLGNCRVDVRWEDNAATGQDADNANAAGTTTISTRGAL